jgi:hypothetical protein
MPEIKIRYFQHTFTVTEIPNVKGSDVDTSHFPILAAHRACMERMSDVYYFNLKLEIIYT